MGTGFRVPEGCWLLTPRNPPIVQVVQVEQGLACPFRISFGHCTSVQASGNLIGKRKRRTFPEVEPKYVSAYLLRHATDTHWGGSKRGGGLLLTKPYTPTGGGAPEP